MAIRSYGLATANSFVKVHRFVRKAIPTGERTILTNQDIRHSLQRRQSPCANALIRRSTSLHLYIHVWRLIIVILGLRHGELAGIKWSDIDENGILAHPAVHKQAGRNQRQQDRERNARHPASTACSVCNRGSERHAQGAWNSDTHVDFPGPDGNRTNTNMLYKQWKLYCKQHGIESTLHELRHPYVKYTTKINLRKQNLRQSYTWIA